MAQTMPKAIHLTLLVIELNLLLQKNTNGNKPINYKVRTTSIKPILRSAGQTKKNRCDEHSRTKKNLNKVTNNTIDLT